MTTHREIYEFVETRLVADLRLAHAAANWVSSGPYPEVGWFGQGDDNAIERFGEAGPFIASCSPGARMLQLAALRSLAIRLLNEEGPLVSLVLMALMYHDHPDFKPEWAEIK